MGFVLRRAEARDYADIDALAAILVGFTADRRASFQRVLADPSHHLIVAEAEGAVVGFAHLMEYEDLSHGKPAGELLALVVREDMRRRGIGTALLQEVRRIAAASGAGELHVNAERENEVAQRLYASLGMEVVGVQMELEIDS
jgi:ribosomal protein S18 acetylase RimI-like enzyme